jgi:hypothetical protein
LDDNPRGGKDNGDGQARGEKGTSSKGRQNGDGGRSVWAALQAPSEPIPMKSASDKCLDRREALIISQHDDNKDLR